MEDMCHVGLISHNALRPLLHQQAAHIHCSSILCFFFFFFVDVFLFFFFFNQCHGFFRALLIMLSSGGLARNRASISAAHARLHTCGWYSLQTVGGRGSGLSPVWLTPGRSERYCTRRWWSKSVLHQHAMCAGAAALEALTFPVKRTHRCSFIYCWSLFWNNYHWLASVHCKLGRASLSNSGRLWQRSVVAGSVPEG